MAPFFYGGNMKIPEGVTKKNIEDQIFALAQTRNEYIAGIHYIGSCKLCKISIKHQYIGIQCGFCPWHWFTKGTCIEHYGKRKLAVNFLSSENGLPIAKNIRNNRKRQIKRWIKKLEEYNDRHK